MNASAVLAIRGIGQGPFGEAWAAAAASGEVVGDVLVYPDEAAARAAAEAALTVAPVTVGLAVGVVDRFGSGWRPDEADGDAVAAAIARATSDQGTLVDADPQPPVRGLSGVLTVCVTGPGRAARALAGALGGPLLDLHGALEPYGPIAAALGVPLVAGRADHRERIGPAIDRPLALDVPGRLVDEVAAALAAWGAAAVVVAPRPLGVPGEVVQRVDGDADPGSAWDALDDEARGILAALAVFRGPITGDAAEAVAPGFLDRRADLAAWLDDADAGWRLDPGLGRWIAAKQPAQQATRAHAEWFGATALATSDALYARGDLAALGQLRGHADNLVAVVQAATRHPEAAARAALGLRWIPAVIPGLLGLLDVAVAAAGRVEDQELRARVHLARGIVLRTVGRALAAEADLDQALALAVLADHKTLAADAMREGAQASLDAGRLPDELYTTLEQAIVLHRSMGNAGREALCWSAMAVLNTGRGQADRAGECIAMARSLADQAGARVVRGPILLRQGLLAAEAGVDPRPALLAAHVAFSGIADRAAAGHCALLLSRAEAVAKRARVAAWWLAEARRALGPIADPGTQAALDAGDAFVVLARSLRAIETGALDVAQHGIAAVGAALEALRTREHDGAALVDRSPVLRTAVRQLELAWWSTPDVVIED